MDDPSRRASATLRANAKLSLYIHLAVYLAVNALLIVINFATSTAYLWFWWPLLGWGIGLALHGLALLAIPKLISLRRRMIEKEMGR
jgi:hypothetical protein